MARVDDMLRRLPQLYRDGELVRDILELPALQLEIAGEDALEVQRAHWFDRTLNLDEAARLAALLDFTPETWQELAEFRAWVHALRDAMLDEGAVTKAAFREFVARYIAEYQTAVKVSAVAPMRSWLDEPSTTRPALIENPRRRRFSRAPLADDIEPLQQFSVVQRGLDETPASFLLIGLPVGPESVPMIANTTTGNALIFLDNLPPGARLWIRAKEDGSVGARLEDRDVSARLRSVTGLQPGIAWSAAQVQQPARALTLRRGRNDLWFLPVAHFDASGLDRFLLALADLLLRQGRFDETPFDQSLFHQQPAALLRLMWIETEPASFEIKIPAGGLISRDGELREALNARERLGLSLNLAVRKLKAAGVAASVELLPFVETQRQMDFMTAVQPVVHRERGPMGADAFPAAGGVFEVTKFENSTYR